MIDALKAFKMDNDQVGELRFLLCGPARAGKSSIINTIKTIFEGRQFVSCLAGAASTTTLTTRYEKYGISIGREGLLPLAFHDIMGVEKKQDDGIHTDDIISALKGHIKEGYVFNAKHQISEENPDYLRNPGLNDSIHCLVNVLQADSIAKIDQEFIDKMRTARQAASRMGIPQVVFMTKVDLVSPMTKADLRYTYRSKKIRNNIQKCSDLLGVPVNCIFPVKNYHEETYVNEDLHCLMLDALTWIVKWANDYVVKCASKPTHVE